MYLYLVNEVNVCFYGSVAEKLYIISCVSVQNKCPVTDPPEPPFGSTANEYFDDTEAPAPGKMKINLNFYAVQI